jgi:formyltetrahydrofolate-dependent phosphoribosylglycinamide formyltransferase
MFQRLKQRWKVNGVQLFFILCVFAVTGTTTAYLTRQVTYWLKLDVTSAWYWIIKLCMLVFGYQILILLFSIPFGQFSFFWNYEKKILQRLGMLKKNNKSVTRDKTHITTDSAHHITGMNQPKEGHTPETQHTQRPSRNPHPETRIAIFASGAGSNAQQIINHFRHHPFIRVALIVCNKPGAGVLNIAAKEQIPTLLIEKEKFFRGSGYADELKEKGIDVIILAGFLWKIPVTLLRAWPQRIINIHPALLPAYGGKGMYGMNVHTAVIAAKEKESGITIHYVDEIYDHGEVIFQAKCTVEAQDTPETLAQKIHLLEHLHYPKVIEKWITEMRK